MSISSTNPEELSTQLSRKDAQVQILQSLLELAASGIDVSCSAERVVRYCLFSANGTTPQVLSLSLDVLTASPTHAYWVDTLSVVVENIQRHGTKACFVAISKIPALPHAALQHLLLFATTAMIDVLQTDISAYVRKSAVHAVASFVLRPRPLTATALEAIHLGQLKDDQLTVVRRGIERMLFALVNAIFDPADEVSITAFFVLTQYAISIDLSDTSIISRTKSATAMAIWDLLVPNSSKIGARFQNLFAISEGERHNIRYRQDAIKGMACLSAYVMGDMWERSSALGASTLTQDTKNWVIGWLEQKLLALCAESNIELAACACSCLLLICSHAVRNPSPEKIANWGISAVRRITRILTDSESQIPILVMTGLLRDAVHGLAALSKNDFVTSKFVVFTTVGILPLAAKCPGKEQRLEAMSVISSTIVEYDLSGRDAGVGNSMKAVLSSSPWKSIMESSQKDSNIPAELLCCLSQSLLEASRKIFACKDTEMRMSLTHTWSVLLSQVMTTTARCLSWSNSPAASYAKELYLKLFDALGQYSAFLQRSQQIGLPEYERLQEVLVASTLDQRDPGTRASLLICITKYWLTSGMKAESNAGHLLKASWKHAQEHYRDEEILLKELKTGALWSDAKGSERTSHGRMARGGYVSITTAISKRTRAVFETVSASVSSLIEATLFGSIALSTAASEGSTLTTDYIYSSLSALLALVSHNPPLAERAITLLNRYIRIMDQAESSDFIALEAVRNSIASLEMYRDEFFPKPVAKRSLGDIMGRDAIQIQREEDDPLAWMHDITESCVFASSRLEDATKGTTTVATEEVILHAASSTKKRMTTFSPQTMIGNICANANAVEGEQQTLHGASDPFSVAVTHTMDTTKGLALLRVEVTNRSQFYVTSASLVYSAAGALTPLPDAASKFPLGAMSHGSALIQRITLAVRSDQGYAGRVFFSLQTKRQNASEDQFEEQNCVPYYIPSSDVLLLRKPAENAGVDVFRRRWDLMRHCLSFRVFIDQDQSVDGFVDMLERRSKCLKQVGRMRTYSHVCALVADSSRGDYVAFAGVAPEAKGMSGRGPCTLYATIRSNSEGYNFAFREECRDWLKSRFRVIFLDDELSNQDQELALRPQDAYFITGTKRNLTPYQRWRIAHAQRVTH